jgi:hypothetical protein
MKATKAQVQMRVEEVLTIRLDGAEFWHVREYAREKEKKEGSAWHLAEGQNPLSDGQLWRYIGKADKMIAESCRASRKKLLRRHLAQRRNLYGKAVNQGDLRTALAVVKDEAELLNLYPTKESNVSLTTNLPEPFNNGERLARILEIAGLQANSGPAQGDDPGPTQETGPAPG